MEAAVIIEGGRRENSEALRIEMFAVFIWQTSIKKEQSIYIGDNWRDIEAANNSGIDSALALYGYIDKKNASLLKPTTKINQIEDLINYI